MKIEKIIDKCKKLLAMAKGSANENESAVAMGQLQKMLAKYNLDLGEIDKEENPIDKEDWCYSSGGLWSRHIISAISELYFCKSVFAKDRKKQVETYFVYGSEINRMVAMEMSQNAIKLINKIANKKAKEYGGGKIDYKYRVSFRNGAAHRIIQRCKELIELAKTGQLVDDDGTKLPALLSTYENQLALVDDHLSKISNIRSFRSSSRSRNESGYKAGTETGNKVKLQNERLKKSVTLIS